MDRGGRGAGRIKVIATGGRHGKWDAPGGEAQRPLQTSAGLGDITSARWTPTKRERWIDQPKVAQKLAGITLASDQT
jgi:hypothetical protein